MMNISDTICAPATSVGTGAISIIRISGPDTFAAVDSVVSFMHGTAAASKGYALKRGSAGDVDDVLAAIFRAPHSYTGEDSAEIYCHASAYIVRRLLELLCTAGCRLAEPGEFTRRAFVNGKMDLAQAEAVADVISSSSEAQHRVALNQLRGGYSAEIASLRAQLLELTSLMELELDFSEEDVEFADRSRLRKLLDEAIARCTSLADSFKTGNAIRNGVPVAIVGAPNSGKSTLLNSLLGDDRAIVSPIPGTTRDTVEETFVLGGILFRFIDTAGIRESSDEVERLGIERTYRKISEAAVVLGVIDVTAEDASAAAKEIMSRVDLKTQKLILLLNKIDVLKGDKRQLHDDNSPLQDSVRSEISADLVVNKNVTDINSLVSSIDYKQDNLFALNISAKLGLGIDKLRECIISLVNIDSSSDIMVTSARHAEALRSAAASLSAVRLGLGTSGGSSSSGTDGMPAPTIPTDLLAEDLRAALDALGTITGEVTTEEVLGEIFKKFCIGK